MRAKDGHETLLSGNFRAKVVAVFLRREENWAIPSDHPPSSFDDNEDDDDGDVVVVRRVKIRHRSS